jgi:hypothetical protein
MGGAQGRVVKPHHMPILLLPTSRMVYMSLRLRDVEHPFLVAVETFHREVVLLQAFVGEVSRQAVVVDLLEVSGGEVGERTQPLYLHEPDGNERASIFISPKVTSGAVFAFAVTTLARNLGPTCG